MTDYAGQQWGNYRLIELIDHGGFTDVYLGQHVRLSSQYVAVKILEILRNPQDREIFERTTNLIAGLTHPHIVRLLDYDIANDVPFLVMEYAPHGSLRKYHRNGEILPLPLVVSYVKQIASALQYVHDRGLVHRDVKPDNMLLNEGGQVLLSDFGIATIARGTSEEGSDETFIGTMPYAAPELLQQRPQPASDQYALGITVYEWLAGQRPFQGSFTEIAFKHANYPPPSLRARNLTLSPIVEQVVFTALAKDPAARFASVQDFADDLESAILETEHELSAVQLVRSAWPGADLPMALDETEQDNLPTQPVARPNLAVSLSEAREDDLPTQPLLVANPVTPPPRTNPDILPAPPIPLANSPVTLLETSQQDVSLSVTSRQSTPAPPIQREEKFSLPETPIPAGGQALPRAKTIEIPGRPRTQQPGHIRFSRRVVLGGLVGAALVGAASTLVALRYQPGTPASTPQHPPSRLRYTYSGHTALVTDVAWSPDGQHLASSSHDHTVQVWQAADGQAQFTYQGHTNSVNAVAWATHGQYIASASYDGSVRIWNGNNGSNVLTYVRHKGVVNSVTWSTSGQSVASGSDDKTVRVWRADLGKTEFVYHKENGIVTTVAWSPGGTRVASAGDDKIARVWDTVNGTGILAYHGHSATINAVAWSPDGTRLASASDDHTVQVWDALTGKVLFTFQGHGAEVKALAWSPDGTRLASAGYDHTVQVWDALTGAHAIVYRGHSANVNGVAWSPDGTSIASASSDTTVQVWRAN